MRYFAALALLLASPAGAAVVGSSANGFEVRIVVNLVVSPDVAFAALGDVSGWWDPEHTYGGDPAMVSLPLRAGGCFCERLPDGGGVEHMHVAYVEPGKRLVMTGSLGPLLYEATAGVMDVQVKRAAGGSQLTLDYKVAGFANGGAEKMAPLVDDVLSEQVKRYRTYVTALPRTTGGDQE
ncbi:MAG TPA: ATPase [Sphingomicrobium sp.]|nr:ATPase [Sphingomicrobium sp.]